MAVTNFIPEIWNAQMLEDFRETAVAASLVNREYEGDATRGNTVHITSAVDVAVKDYKAAGRTTAADAVSDTGQDLLIDQEKSFDFYVDDIDRRQAAGSMDAYTRSAAAGLAEDSDKFILATAVTGAGSTTTGDGATTPAAVTNPADIFRVLRDLRKVLNKAKVPQGGRVALINAEFEAMLLDADAKLTSVDVSGSPAGLREATLGRLLGFDLVTTENLPVVDKAQALALYRPSVAYVSQITETEGMRAQDKFADRLRGLHVYGGKVIRPKGVAVWTNA
ncbi:P22 phage major capsid protein family protein [Prauserella muralis]|uniref:Uncharacterized protein n=1 Tax=Prauserella muralis TaxID=588067 RepID=A0A2V4AKT2_9PSEU|nr:P22 phage major capsid protein family protein [Prauserella muralis]PXY20885.1 hypothetical protein BAY60_25615 [Prauserella muralis]TWE29926.1 P22 coat protein Gp5 [Prauserella muralis]